MAKTAHEFDFATIDGEPLPLSTYKDKAVLVVNTASFCGYTKQYTNLQAVWESYRDKGLGAIALWPRGWSSLQETRSSCRSDRSPVSRVNGRRPARPGVR